ncbi:MAG: hypothetical protein CMJ47_11550 [Planctomyces sp.]|nr:hypothetical protein [Planctomyces sp.]
MRPALTVEPGFLGSHLGERDTGSRNHLRRLQTIKAPAVIFTRGQFATAASYATTAALKTKLNANRIDTIARTGEDCFGEFVSLVRTALKL